MSKPLSDGDELVKELDKLYTDSVLEHSRNAEHGQGEDEEVFKLPDAILVIDLNSREPMAAFVAPSLGISKPRFLPVFKTMSKAHLLYLTESKYDLESGSLNQVNREWTKELLSHCQRLLLEELGMPLERINLQVSLTSRSDVSERDKFLLLQAAQDAGYQAPQLQLIPTVKAVAISGFISHGAGEDDIHAETLKREIWRFGDSVLVICHNGDVIDIQSYSISRGPIVDKSVEPRLKLEEIVSGSTVESRRLAEQQFTAWLEKSFGKSFLPGTKGLEPEGQLLSAFAEELRGYEPKRQKHYKFPLIISSPADDAPYDPLDNCCVVPNSKMREFSMSAIDFLLESLEDNYTRIQNKKKKIDKILFAEPKSCSPYLKDFVTDWGSGMGILSRQTDIFVGLMTHELK
jgi:hypothetical protein